MTTFPTRSIAALTAAIAILSAAGLARAQSCLAVEVQNLRPSQGPLMLAAYADAESFGKTAVAQMQVEVGTATSLPLQVCGLAGTEVGLMLFQDLNRNGKLDRNPFGVPNEPWGASGRPAMLGPGWDSARVPVGTPVVVRMSN